MTREDALLKLLAVEPETRPRLIVVTGWPAEETSAVLDKLVAEKRVTYINGGGYGAEGARMYYPRPA